MDNVEIFKDQTTIVLSSDVTPVFDGGTPTRDGYIFKGWTPSVSENVTANVIYTAVWEKKAVPKTGDDSNLLLWAMLLVVSCGLFGTTVYSGKRAKNK